MCISLLRKNMKSTDKKKELKVYCEIHKSKKEREYSGESLVVILIFLLNYN